MSVCLAVRESEDGGVVHAARGTCLLAVCVAQDRMKGRGAIAPGRYT